MKTNLKDREFSKFRDGASGDAVATTYDGDLPLPIESAGVDWDEVITTFPGNHQDLFTYKKNNVTVQTVLVQYESNQKKSILYMQRTRF